MPIPEDYYEARFLFQSNASPRVMSTACGFLRDDLTTPTASEAALEIRELSVDTGMPMDNAEYIDDYTFLGVEVALGTATGDIIGQDLLSAVGTLVDSVVPSNCAMIVQKNTASGGRRYRGRFYFPPIILNDGAVDPAGNINSTPLGTMQGNFDAWWTALVAAHWVPVLFHQGAGAPAPTPITSFTVQSLIGTQRRRMRS